MILRSTGSYFRRSLGSEARILGSSWLGFHPEYRSRELQALQLTRLELFCWRMASARLALPVFVDIAIRGGNPRVRVTSTTVWKLCGYEAAKLRAPCFGFVDVVRGGLQHAEAVNVHR